jgi:hypothetical protein
MPLYTFIHNFLVQIANEIGLQKKNPFEQYTIINREDIIHIGARGSVVVKAL